MREAGAAVDADKEFAKQSNMPTRVLSGFHVTVTVHESLDGKQFDQGSFFRKLPIILDGFMNPELPVLEVVGAVCSATFRSASG